jgi:hypothetical protein
MADTLFILQANGTHKFLYLNMKAVISYQKHFRVKILTICCHCVSKSHCHLQVEIVPDFRLPAAGSFASHRTKLSFIHILYLDICNLLQVMVVITLQFVSYARPTPCHRDRLLADFI